MTEFENETSALSGDAVRAHNYGGSQPQTETSASHASVNADLARRYRHRSPRDGPSAHC